MQKPNYQFEKRRKELDKKAKKEEKRRQKLAAPQSAAGNDAASPVPNDCGAHATLKRVSPFIRIR